MAEDSPREPFIPPGHPESDEEVAETQSMPSRFVPKILNEALADGSVEIDPTLRASMDEVLEYNGGRFHVSQLVQSFFGKDKVRGNEFDPLMQAIRGCVDKGELIKLGKGNYQGTKKPKQDPAEERLSRMINRALKS